jgi:hypothetical protein
MEVTKEEFEAYTDVQHSGVTNMFDVRTVSSLSGLGRSKVIEIMNKYDILLNKYNEDEA